MSKAKKAIHLTRLVVGDYSGDGHRIHDSFSITSNLDTEQITAAYWKGTEIVGFNFVDVVAEAYEDGSIHVPEARKLLAAGLDLNKYLDEDPYNDDGGVDPCWLNDDSQAWLGSMSFTDIYLEICKLGNPEFTWEFNDGWKNTIEIGGYGLFGG